MELQRQDQNRRVDWHDLPLGQQVELGLQKENGRRHSTQEEHSP